MKIKTKLTFGVGSLFLMILLLALISSWYITDLKKDTNNILKANYNTLQYAKNMLLALENVATDSVALDTFEENLNRQRQNVTERGEAEATELIFQHFSAFKSHPEDAAMTSGIRKDITELMRLNMEAIERKSDIADATAQKAIVVVSISGTLCFIIAFILLVNLPANIADPIAELTSSIKAIANQNYKKRVNFEGHNEYGELAKSFNTMAKKLEEYSESRLEKILKAKMRIEALIDTMHDPVIGVDEHRKVLFANAEALKITGLKKEDFVGKQIQDVAVVNDLVRDIIKDMIHPLSSNSTSHTPMKIFADNKESYFEKEVLEIKIIPTGENKAQHIGQVILLKNITPFKELDLAKTNFMGTVSHEFKTPIASLQMGIQLLENEQIGSLNDEQKDLISGMKEDTKRLLKITGELLNITQVESGSIQISVLPSAIRPMIDYAVNANKVAAEQKQIRFEIQQDEDASMVMADSEKTAWVLTNLLSNAIRYSYEHSTIHITVEKGDNIVRFSVKDNGQGIPTQYLGKIFERYFRIPGTKKQGTGLGLSISKEFIEAQGGEISVVSEYGTGSTFSFFLHMIKENR
ncbi:PAS domain-containing protein [Olivibacter sp. SDN3]|uniref:ATP-binding protein n=1 Tax=Olivibacter sp. SDN3 TaxID=2764720 RepID=UPI001650EAE3|nr:ATP-binding protein [Olivibacter sp. SDN3]QNL49804.1 PAS domain-containing protein [Olivibacter sp. SDN3]